MAWIERGDGPTTSRLCQPASSHSHVPRSVSLLTDPPKSTATRRLASNTSAGALAGGGDICAASVGAAGVMAVMIVSTEASSTSVILPWALTCEAAL